MNVTSLKLLCVIQLRSAEDPSVVAIPWYLPTRDRSRVFPVPWTRVAPFKPRRRPDKYYVVTYILLMLYVREARSGEK